MTFVTQNVKESHKKAIWIFICLFDEIEIVEQSKITQKKRKTRKRRKYDLQFPINAQCRKERKKVAWNPNISFRYYYRRRWGTNAIISSHIRTMSSKISLWTVCKTLRGKFYRFWKVIDGTNWVSEILQFSVFFRK